VPGSTLIPTSPAVTPWYELNRDLQKRRFSDRFCVRSLQVVAADAFDAHLPGQLADLH
jgi:hypothetical protein